MPPDLARLLFPGAPASSPVTTLPVDRFSHAQLSAPRQQLGALIGIDHGASNEWVISGAPHAHPQADPRQRSPSRAGGADPLVPRPHRHAGAFAQGASVPGVPGVLLGRTTISPGASPPPTPTPRICSSRRRIRKTGPISDARRRAAVHRARRDHPRQRCARHHLENARDAPRPGSFRYR